MQRYVVIDTNVLVSALITRNENSPTVKILRFLSESQIIPVYSSEIIKEYYEVLKRDKFRLPENVIFDLLNDIISNGYEVKDIAEVKEQMPDPKDVVFYAVTMSASNKDTLLVTVNGKHFPIKPFVVTPAELVSLMEDI